MSSKGSGVEIGSGSRSKLRSWNPIPYSFPHNGIWLSRIGDSSSRMTGMGIKTDSKMLLKLGNKIGVNSIQEFELDHKFEDRSHILVWVQFFWKENLPICQWNIQKYEISQVQYDDHKKLVIQFHDG